MRLGACIIGDCNFAGRSRLHAGRGQGLSPGLAAGTVGLGPARLHRPAFLAQDGDPHHAGRARRPGGCRLRRQRTRRLRRAGPGLAPDDRPRPRCRAVLRLAGVGHRARHGRSVRSGRRGVVLLLGQGLGCAAKGRVRRRCRARRRPGAGALRALPRRRRGQPDEGHRFDALLRGAAQPAGLGREVHRLLRAQSAPRLHPGGRGYGAVPSGPPVAHRTGADHPRRTRRHPELCRAARNRRIWAPRCSRADGLRASQ